MVKHAHILCIATPTIFHEIINAVEYALKYLGIEKVTVEYAFKRDPCFPFSKELNIIFKAQRPFDLDSLPSGSLKVLFQTEQYSKLREFNTLPYADDWDLIIDVFDQCMVSSKTKVVKIGYDPVYNHTHLKPNDLDIYFFGARTPYRMEWKRQFEKKFGKKYKVRFANNDVGVRKYQNILGAKINLFIPAWIPSEIPGLHCAQILCNNKLLLVDGAVSYNEHTIPNDDMFRTFNKHNFVELITPLLDDEKLRSAYCEAYFNNYTAQESFPLSFINIMKEYI